MPNGYLHIGHAKSICLNFGIAEEFDGTCNLRYNDTNPLTESPEYADSIARDKVCSRGLVPGISWSGRGRRAGSDGRDHQSSDRGEALGPGRARRCRAAGRAHLLGRTGGPQHDAAPAEGLGGTISPEVLPRLSELYTSDVRFRDPLKDLRGFDDLRAYYAEFLELAEGGTFTIDRWIESEHEAALTWTMCLPPTEDNPEEDSERRCFGGMSHLVLAPDGEAITAQRDYFDLGEAVYEQVSVLRWIHRRVKARF